MLCLAAMSPGSGTETIEREGEEREVFAFKVQSMGACSSVEVRGGSLGDLRKSIQDSFGVPPFEQSLQFKHGDNFTPLLGDDSVRIQEKPGLVNSEVLILVRQLDPRFKMEKQTAFLDALVARRFRDAEDILTSSGACIDPNYVLRQRVNGRAVTECPVHYSHPAMTVAIQAGLEDAICFSRCDAQKMSAFMSQEEEVAKVVQLLIKMNADVNASGDETQDCESAGSPTVHNKTPLCAAVQRGSPALVRLLLDARADPSHTHQYDGAAYGPDRWNPLGPGVLKPESWLRDICNGSVTERRERNDPRAANHAEILQLLREAECSG